MNDIDDPTELALHYGIVAQHGIHAAIKGERIIRPTDPFGGLEVDGLTVDGTWQTWGETDEDSGSLHVVADGLIGDTALAAVAATVAAMVNNRIRSGRLLDHAFVTLSRDHSVKTHIVTFGSYGFSTNDTYVSRIVGPLR